MIKYLINLGLMDKWSCTHSLVVLFYTLDAGLNMFSICRQFLELLSLLLGKLMHSFELITVLSLSLPLAFCFRDETKLWNDEQ